MSNDKVDYKNTLISIFKDCLNILRDNEGLTGKEALRNMSYLLILKLLEPRFGKEINIDNYEYDFSHIQDELVEPHKKKLLDISRFSNLVKEKEDNILTNINYLWDDILSVHPSTKNIFLKNSSFDIQRQKTFTKLFQKLMPIKLTNSDYDILGNAYEEVIQDIMTGKILGQYFTQPLVKKMMVKLIDPQIHHDGKIESCGDPTMGTGGFLISYLQHILEKAKEKGIDPDWDFIKTDGLYGKELDATTYQLAISNMLISSGHMFENIEKGDSIREPITRKFDNILANPPFGINGLEYSEFHHILKSEYLPIDSNHAVSLFLQAIIYMLNINGKCAVVLPAGRELFSKKNITLRTVKEYLMKTCDLKEIIHLPTGIFTYTSIPTCVFYFVKKREGKDVLSVVNSKKYKFVKEYQTIQVKFYDYNPTQDTKKLLAEVSIDDIVENSYSLNYCEYINEKKDDNSFDCKLKTLGELCKFLPKSKRNAKFGNKTGLYPFFKSSNKVDSYVNEPDYKEESLIIGDGGEPNINYGINFSASDHCYILQNKNNEKFNLKYAYYYLHNNLDMMRKLYTGVAIKNISKTNIESIRIPFPSIEKQQNIVDLCDKNEKRNKDLEIEIEENKKRAKSYITDLLGVKNTEEEEYNQEELKELEELQKKLELQRQERKKTKQQKKMEKK